HLSVLLVLILVMEGHDVNEEVAVTRAYRAERASRTQRLHVRRRDTRNESGRYRYRTGRQVYGVRDTQIEVEGEPPDLPGCDAQVMRVVELHGDRERARDRGTRRIHRGQCNGIAGAVICRDLGTAVVDRQFCRNVFGCRNLPGGEDLAEID